MLRVHLFRGYQRVFGGSAAQVILPGTDGDVAILDCHAPMLCSLAEGTVQVDEARFAVQRGVARVDRNTVTIVAS